MVVIRHVRIALPFILIALGGATLYGSPWPAILRLALGGAHVRVALAVRTVVPPLITIVAWGSAVWLSLRR